MRLNCSPARLHCGQQINSLARLNHSPARLHCRQQVDSLARLKHCPARLHCRLQVGSLAWLNHTPALGWKLGHAYAVPLRLGLGQAVVGSLQLWLVLV